MAPIPMATRYPAAVAYRTVCAMVGSVPLAEADAAFTAALRAHPELINVGYENDALLPAGMFKALKDGVYGMSTGEISALVYAFRHRLVGSVLHILDSQALPVDGAYFGGTGSSYIDSSLDSLLAASIGRLVLPLNGTILDTEVGNRFCREARDYMAPYLELARGLVARGAKADLRVAGTSDVSAKALNLTADKALIRHWKKLTVETDHRVALPIGVLEVLVAGGADPTAAGLAYLFPEGWKDPEMRATLKAAFVRMVELGLDPDAASTDDRFGSALPIDHAIRKRNELAVDCLLAAGVDMGEERGFRRVEEIASFCSPALVASARALVLSQTAAAAAAAAAAEDASVTAPAVAVARMPRRRGLAL